MIDICFILEGTYPYVTGGVSEWVQTVMTGLPDFKFGIIHLTAGENGDKQSRYPRPANLHHLVEWPLDIEPEGEMADFSQPLPPARLYHALSTGFAGMLGCQIKSVSGQPFILTEHGIYWQEIEAGADELECGFRLVPNGQDNVNLQPLRHHWRIKLQDMARQAYQQADAITTVCQANLASQARLDAPLSRTQVIPNSVDWPVFSPKTERQPAPDGIHRIGFVGRVVTIKDVVTFIKACSLVADKLPQAEFYIIGPLDQDPAYVEQCRELAAELGLTGRLTFTGETDPLPWYHRLDVVTLTSLSEGQPLVLLEAMAAGVPLIATGVGGCPELILGTTPEDQALGSSGLLTPTESPEVTAAAIYSLCLNQEQWQEASAVGRARVRRFYSTEQLCQAYRSLYRKWL